MNYDLEVLFSSVDCPYWSVALSLIRRQSTQSSVLLQAEWIPVLAQCISALVPLSQVVYMGSLKVFSNEMVVGVMQ